MRCRRPVAAVCVAVLAAATLAACDGGSGSSEESATSGSATEATICEPEGTAQADADLPAVGVVAEAVAALETELGGPQEYFEVNATARVVNLFVALNDATLAQAWAYVDGELSSQEPQAASGGTFTATQLDFDPESILVPTRGEIPDSIIETFYVHGDGKGKVQYGLLTSALCGGGLDLTVGPAGEVLGVDPV